jgi:hypothetical protein
MVPNSCKVEAPGVMMTADRDSPFFYASNMLGLIERHTASEDWRIRDFSHLNIHYITVVAGSGSIYQYISVYISRWAQDM